MTSLEEEILEIEKYIKSLEMNDNTHKEINETIKDGMAKGLIYDFQSTNYRGTMFSNNVVKYEEYIDFQNYINKCEQEEQDKFSKWKEEMIKSGDDFSKDELKYYKIL
jgi:hypothetical protein